MFAGLRREARADGLSLLKASLLGAKTVSGSPSESVVVRLPSRKRAFLSFPYVCPEPVLVKSSF